MMLCGYGKLVALILALGLSSPSIAAEPVKNIILIIGDGMGPQQVSLAMIYARQAPNSPYKKDGLNIEKMMNLGTTGYMLTYPAGAVVVDSAASATQLATGEFAGSEMIGVDAFGEPRETILEKAIKAGKRTGLVTNTRLTHATPASFAAHQAHRSMEAEIASDMIATGPDIMLSAGLRYFLPRSVNDSKSKTYKEMRQLIPEHIKITSRRKDESNLVLTAKGKGYALAFDRDDLRQHTEGKVLGLFHSSAMPDAIKEKQIEQDPKRKIPTLKDMTESALNNLAKSPSGFFLMVEGGQVDWAGHHNDAGRMLNEMIQFDKAIGAILEFAKDRKDTLVVLTADHETGSFGLSYSRYKIPKSKKLKGKAFQNVNFAPAFNFGEPSLLDKMYNQQESFASILGKFDSYQEKNRTPKKLREMVNAVSEFDISIIQAGEILATEPNEYRVEGHPYLGAKEWPVVGDFKEYYVYGKDTRANLLGRALARDQNVVWGTGTHTTTMVPVVALGPADIRQLFNGVQHSTEVGRKLMSSFGLKPNS